MKMKGLVEQLYGQIIDSVYEHVTYNCELAYKYD